jgi:predicted ATPase
MWPITRFGCADGAEADRPWPEAAIRSIAVTPYDKQLQRTVVDKVSSHMRQRAAAELRRYAVRFVVLALSLVFAISCGNATELLESVQLVNGGAALSCDYTQPDDRFTFTCRGAYTVFALRCVSESSRHGGDDEVGVFAACAEAPVFVSEPQLRFPRPTKTVVSLVMLTSA